MSMELEPNTRVLKNGAVYDMDKKRIVSAVNVTTKITSENAVAMQSRRQEIKRERAQLGANRALQALRRKKWNDGTKRWDDDGPEWENPSDLDFVEAITEAQAAQALLVGDPASTKAAEFVFTHTGYSEKQAQDTPQVQAADAVNALTSLVRAVADAIDKGNYRNHEQVIDITSSESSTGADAGGGGAGG